MSEELVSSQNVSNLINHLIKTKDPATVGLRRILKKKAKVGQDFPLQVHILEELSSDQDALGKVFNETEQRVIELEKATIELKNRLTKQKKNAEKAIQEAYKTGLKEGAERGEKSGHEKAQSEYEQQIKVIEERLLNIFKNIEESQKSILDGAHRGVLDLSTLIARKIINTELSLNTDIVLNVIKKALSYIADRKEFIVRVAPDDISTVTQKRDFWTSISERLDKVSIEEDERIERGGCIIESNAGVADARINVQIGELIEVIDSTWDSLMTSESVSNDNDSEDNESQE